MAKEVKILDLPESQITGQDYILVVQPDGTHNKGRVEDITDQLQVQVEQTGYIGEMVSEAEAARDVAVAAATGTSKAVGGYDASTGVAVVAETGATSTLTNVAGIANGSYWDITKAGNRAIAVPPGGTTPAAVDMLVGGRILSTGTKYIYVPPKDTGYDKVTQLESGIEILNPNGQLYDASTVVVGFQIGTSSSSYAITAEATAKIATIPVVAGNSYTISWEGGQALRYARWENAAGNLISGFDVTSRAYATGAAPIGTTRLTISVKRRNEFEPVEPTNMKVQLGSTATPGATYIRIFDGISGADNTPVRLYDGATITTPGSTDASVTNIAKVKSVITGELTLVDAPTDQLYNKDADTLDAGINGSGDVTVGGAFISARLSSYIPVTPATDYVWSWVGGTNDTHRATWYNAAQVKISFFSLVNGTYTTSPALAAFVRFTSKRPDANEPTAPVVKMQLGRIVTPGTTYNQGSVAKVVQIQGTVLKASGLVANTKIDSMGTDPLSVASKDYVDGKVNQSPILLDNSVINKVGQGINSVVNFGWVRSRGKLDFPADIMHVLMLGQSNTVGGGNASITNMSLTQPYNSLRFVGGVRAWDGGTGTDVYNSLIPLVEQISLTRGETPGSGFANAMVYLVNSINGLAHDAHQAQWLMSSPHNGGLRLDEIMEGTSYFTRAVNDVTYGKIQANNQGKTYDVPFLIYIQGGSDIEAGTTATLYKQRLLTYWQQVNTAFKAIIGKTEDIKFLVLQHDAYKQYGAALPTIAWAQYEICLENPDKFIFCSPSYQVEHYTDNIHWNSYGMRRIGAHIASVAKRALIDNEAFSPFRVTRKIVQANIIELTYDAPTLPLAFDASMVTNPGNYGYSVVNSGGTALNFLKAPELVRRNVVRITLEAAVPTGAILYYGVNGTGGGPINGGRGNLRDSQGYNLNLTENLTIHNYAPFHYVNL